VRSVVLALVFSCGCGPVGYFGTVTRDATRAVTEARAAGAAQAAPYEWTAALLYLERSRELAGYARWQDALTLGRRAAALARAAAERARLPAEAR
jgi:hypothetical protein